MPGRSSKIVALAALLFIALPGTVRADDAAVHFKQSHNALQNGEGG